MADPASDASTVTWLGHGTVAIELNGVRFLTDPVLRNAIGPLRRRVPLLPTAAAPDVVLISHLHHDHLDRPSLRLIDRTATLVLPAGAGRFVRDLGFAAVHELAPTESLTIGGVDIRAVEAHHSGRRLPLIGRSSEALGFVLGGDRVVYFAGDTDLFPQMAGLAPRVDLALLPVGGWGPTLRGGHLDPARAARAAALIAPRMAMPIHWGTYWPIGLARVRGDRFHAPGQRFATEMAEAAPAVRVIVAAHGQTVAVD